jgi:hypothetical protein
MISITGQAGAHLQTRPASHCSFPSSDRQTTRNAGSIGFNRAIAGVAAAKLNSFMPVFSPPCRKTGSLPPGIFASRVRLSAIGVGSDWTGHPTIWQYDNMIWTNLARPIRHWAIDAILLVSKCSIRCF